MNINHRTAYPFRLGKAIGIILIAITLQGCGTEADSVHGSDSPTAQNDHQMNAHDTAIASLHLVEARVNEPAPGQRMSAGYFTLMNHGTEAITLTAITSDSANVQMHTTTREASGTTMRPLNEIIIAPNSQVVFQPGGNHLMISNAPPNTKSMPMTMTFDNGGSLKADFTVIPMDTWMNKTQ